MSPNCLIVSFALLLISFGTASAARQECTECHAVTPAGLHARLSCADCHGRNQQQAHSMGAQEEKLCGRCHRGEIAVLHGAMASRTAEKEMIARSFARHDADFAAANCGSCHLSSCSDCHGSGHALQRPNSETCVRCHKGSFVGWDYLGRAPREDSLRYQRGPKTKGEHYLQMRPDIHAERGLECGECHGMASLAAGKKSAKSCVDCHQPDPKVIEHGISAHLEKMECTACHSAWSAQEYGSFYLKMIDSPARDYFRVKQDTNSNYIKSAYLKLWESPPLGLNTDGRVSPLRPWFLYFSEIVEGDPIGEENRKLLAAWQPFTPHSIRRGAPMCDQCHENPRRFLLEPAERRIYRPDLDGLQISSFWDRTGQEVIGGSFYPAEKVEKLAQKSPEYTRNYVKKWQQFLQHVDVSSGSPSR